MDGCKKSDWYRLDITVNYFVRVKVEQAFNDFPKLAKYNQI